VKLANTLQALPLGRSCILKTYLLLLFAPSFLFFLRRVSEALGRFLFQQLVLALDFCHRRGKVCRGVKLANTLLALAPGQLPLVKLADFGFSKDVGQHGAPQSQV
jgi:serine/threonine protein kinase